MKKSYETYFRELQPVLTLAYVLAVGIGMLFSSQKYAEFGINIFEYADVFDFLIAPFSDINILFFTAISLAITYGLLRLDVLWRKTFPKSYSAIWLGQEKRSWFDLVRYGLFLCLFCQYLYISSDYYGEIARDQILLQPSIQITFVDNEIKAGILVGQTKEVLFLTQADTVEVIPLTSFVKGVRLAP